MSMAPRARQRFYGAPDTYLHLLASALSGRISSGDQIAEFERALARRLGRRNVVALPQNRVGTYLVLKRLPPGRRRVILSPYTIHDVVNMVISADCTPVFADVEPDTGNISLESARQLVTEDVGGILVTHLHGISCDITGFRELSRRNGLHLIEDCAQALGASVSDKPIGSFGDSAVYSFGMAKNVNTLYGGAVATDDDALASDIRAEIAGWPVFPTSRLLSRAAYLAASDVLLSRPLFPLLTFRVFRYGHLNDIDAITNRLKGEDNPSIKHKIPGAYKTRFTAAQARLGLRQLPGVDLASEERRRLAKLYRAGLGNVGPLVLPRPRPDHDDIYLVYPVQPPDRDDLIRFMLRNGCDVSASHYHNCAEVDAYASYNGDCPVAASVARRMMYLPCYPGYREASVRRNIEAIREYFGNAGGRRVGSARCAA